MGWFQSYWLILAIYVGADLNAPIIWFYIAMIVYLKRLAEVESPIVLTEGIMPAQPIPQPAEQS
jgi:hypothetical protein